MKALVRWLDETNTTQTELARRLGVSQPTISDLVRGKNLPSAKLLMKLAQETGLSTDELLSANAA